LKLDSITAYLVVQGHKLDKIPVPSMPQRLCTNLLFLVSMQIIAK